MDYVLLILRKKNKIGENTNIIDIYKFQLANLQSHNNQW